MDSSVDYAFSLGFVASGTTPEGTQEWTQNGLWSGLLVLFKFYKCSWRCGPRLELLRIGTVFVFPLVLPCFSRDSNR